MSVGAQNKAEVDRIRNALKDKVAQAVLEPPRSQCKSMPSSDGSFNEKGGRKMFFSTFIVRKHERGLLYKNGDFIRFLLPGTYRYFNLLRRYTVERFDASTPAFDHRLIDYLVEAERDSVDQLFEVVQTAADEIAVVYLNEQVDTVLGPAERKLYWKGLVTTRVEVFKTNDSLELEPRLAKRLITGADARVLNLADRVVYARIVPESHIGLFYVDGVLTKTLDAGMHAFWKNDRALTIDLVDLRVKTLEVQGQEILTKDKVNLRINVTATYQYEDALKAIRTVKDPLDHLYKEIQFGLRAVVGTQTLDALLEDKTAIDRAVAEYLGTRFADIGIAVHSIGVKDIILPGDMKELLGKVVEAEKAAQANVIRRREETNATRSLLNTAKVMESNAVALRLKELETLEKVTENVGKLTVHGGLDGVLNDLVRLK